MIVVTSSEPFDRSGPVPAAVRAAGYISEDEEETDEEGGSSMEEEETDDEHEEQLVRFFFDRNIVKPLIPGMILFIISRGWKVTLTGCKLVNRPHLVQSLTLNETTLLIIPPPVLRVEFKPTRTAMQLRRRLVIRMSHLDLVVYVVNSIVLMTVNWFDDLFLLRSIRDPTKVILIPLIILFRVQLLRLVQKMEKDLDCYLVSSKPWLDPLQLQMEQLMLSLMLLNLLPSLWYGTWGYVWSFTTPPSPSKRQIIITHFLRELSLMLLSSVTRLSGSGWISITMWFLVRFHELCNSSNISLGWGLVSIAFPLC